MSRIVGGSGVSCESMLSAGRTYGVATFQAAG